jgi:hypothetical protein
MASRFRKKPVVIEAVRYEGDPVTRDVAMGFAGPHATYGMDGNKLLLRTDEGVMEASPGDWIIKGVVGEVYPCKPNVFALTYEPIYDNGNGVDDDDGGEPFDTRFLLRREWWWFDSPFCLRLLAWNPKVWLLVFDVSWNMGRYYSLRIAIGPLVLLDFDVQF